MAIGTTKLDTSDNRSSSNDTSGNETITNDTSDNGLPPTMKKPQETRNQVRMIQVTIKPVISAPNSY